MQSSSEVWVVYYMSGGGMDSWESAREVIVAEHSTKHAADEDARYRDWGKDMGSTNWHHVRKANKSVSYH